MGGPLPDLEVTSTPALLFQALDKHLWNLSAHSDLNGGSYDSFHRYLVGLWPSEDQRMQSWWEALDYRGRGIAGPERTGAGPPSQSRAC